MTIDVVWNCRSADLADLIDKCARGQFDFGELKAEFRRRGYSDRYVFEAVVNRERELSSPQEKQQSESA